MSSVTRWDNGGWNVICDACGRKFKEHELQLRWDGLMVCRGDWEPRQPQDFVHGVADKQAPPYVRPEQQDYFIPINFTQQYDDAVEVNESVTKDTIKVFGGRLLDSNSAVNGTYLNDLGLNVISYLGVDPEEISLSEVVLIELGRSVSDTLTFSETTAITLFSPTALNGSVLNSLRLD